MNLEQLLQQAREKRKALYESIKNAATTEELDKIELDIRKADIEIKTLEEQIQARDNVEDDPSARSYDNGSESRGFNPLATFGNGASNQEERDDEEDIYSSLEYRKAFRDYVVSGTPIPNKFRKTEERASEITVVTDVAAVIPTTILNRVIEDMTVEGKILARITQTSYQGGIDIPISEILPEAKWLTDEKTVSDEQKAKMEAKVSFGYHILEARVAVGLLAATVSLPVFEQTIVKQLKKAMIKAIEKSIVSGTGSGQPQGFTKIDVPASNVVEMSDKDIESVKGWAKAEAAVGEAYDDENLVYMMSKQTWDMHVNSMVDSTGQKIGLGRLDEKGRKILNGREVLTTDQFKSYENTEASGIFGALVNLEQYLLNSNLQMYYKKYYDEDKNKYVHKSLMIADGKMAIGKDSQNNIVGAGGLIFLKKPAGK